MTNYVCMYIRKYQLLVIRYMVLGSPLPIHFKLDVAYSDIWSQGTFVVYNSIIASIAQL